MKNIYMNSKISAMKNVLILIYQKIVILIVFVMKIKCLKLYYMNVLIIVALMI